MGLGFFFAFGSMHGLTAKNKVTGSDIVKLRRQLLAQRARR